MEHSNLSELIWLTEFSPQEQQGKPIETGIILLIMDIKNYFHMFFKNLDIKSMEDFGECI